MKPVSSNLGFSKLSQTSATKPDAEVSNQQNVNNSVTPPRDTFVPNQSIFVDLKALPEQFSKIESDYCARHNKAVTDSSDAVSSFDFLNNHLKPYDILESKYRTGKEYDLMTEVQTLAQENKKTGKKIGPDDLYRLSLELNDGDRFKALVTVQDALKMTGRASQVGTESAQDMKKLVGEDFFNDYVKKNGGKYSPDMANKMGEAYLTKNFKPIGSYSDFTGRYYHMFGTASASTSGFLGDVATVTHAAQRNFKGNLEANHKYLRQDYWNGVPIMEQFSKYIVTPVISVFAGGHFYGEYTTVGHDKWGADKTGMSIAHHLKASDQPEIDFW